MTVRLVEITEENFFDARRLAVSERQRDFLDDAVGILARGYVYRDAEAKVLGIEADGALVGLALVKAFTEAPLGYDLQQFLIDERYQNRGIGTAALRLILDRLFAEGRFDRVEVCVKREAKQALRVYEKVGFVDSGYVDPACPDCVNLLYCFSAASE